LYKKTIINHILDAYGHIYGLLGGNTYLVPRIFRAYVGFASNIAYKAARSLFITFAAA
jgi:hypothetical protein